MSCYSNPFSNSLEPGWEQLVSSIQSFTNDSSRELISYNVPQGQTLCTIPLSVVKASANMQIFGPPTLVNTIDAAVLNITYTVVHYSTSSIIVELSAQVDSSNYYLTGFVIVTS